MNDLGNATIIPIKFESLSETTKENAYEITPERNQMILDYVLPRIRSEFTNRSHRAVRFGYVDRTVMGWQKLSDEDTNRLNKEVSTGQPQGISAVLPITDTQVEETAAFFTEIFCPASGNFYSNQGKPDQVSSISKLAAKMEGDMKRNSYYSTVSRTMRTLLKYNFGGFDLAWQDANDSKIGADKMGGNILRHLDVYNLFYDSSIKDVTKLRTEGEWYAQAFLKNRLWLLRGAKEGRFSQIDAVMKARGDNIGFTGMFYRHPPLAAGINEVGTDTATSNDTTMDWDGYMPQSTEPLTYVNGHEVIEMTLWLNPNQFEFRQDGKDDLLLYRITIADQKFVIQIQELEQAVELPIFLDQLRKDEMLLAQKSYVESIRPLQRHISFMANIAIAVERGNTYGLKAIDPSMFNKEDFRPGETSGIVVSKVAGRDVRSGIMPLNTDTDTSRQYNAIASLIGLMKEMFPSQGLPAQVAGIDRAVTSQVAAVMISAVRRLHRLVRELDSTLFNPMRVACYRNYIDFDPEARDFTGITEKDVANLLNSGLGQLNREVAAAAIERLLFTLIQNPNSAAGFDLPGLFKYWSQMLNTGTDLSQYVTPQAGAGQQSAIEPIDPNNPQNQGVGAGQPGGVAA